LAIVPARGGSKGVSRKNLHPLRGIPLVAHTGALIQKLGYFDRAIVSTDDEEIARVCREVGLDSPFRRPAELSGDLVSDLQVLTHAVTEIERLDGRAYDIIVMLQPTSPLRQPAHVTACILKLIEGAWDATWTVSPTDFKYHPLKQLRLKDDGSLDYFDARGASIIARQQLTPVYHRNGAAYAFSRNCLLSQKTIKGTRTAAVIIEDPMISIDTLEDFQKVEVLMLP
jgi:CMP-N,N'-diacetyllegionaminic acid synthase